MQIYSEYKNGNQIHFSLRYASSDGNEKWSSEYVLSPLELQVFLKWLNTCESHLASDDNPDDDFDKNDTFQDQPLIFTTSQNQKIELPSAVLSKENLNLLKMNLLYNAFEYVLSKNNLSFTVEYKPVGASTWNELKGISITVENMEKDGLSSKLCIYFPQEGYIYTNTNYATSEENVYYSAFGTNIDLKCMQDCVFC